MNQVVECFVHGQHGTGQCTVRQACCTFLYKHRLSAQAVFSVRHSGRFHSICNGYRPVRSFAQNDQPDDIIMQVFAVADHFAEEPVICHGGTRHARFTVMQGCLCVESVGNVIRSPVTGFMNLFRVSLCMTDGYMDACGTGFADKFLASVLFRCHCDQPDQ